MTSQYHVALRYAGGRLFWRTTGRGRNPELEAGYLGSGGYWYVNVNYKMTKRSKIVWELHNGHIPADLDIDHIDGNRANDLIENLRLVSRADNLKNRKLSRNNSSGIHGVRFRVNRNVWTAGIESNGVVYNLYYGPDLFEACCRRKSAELLHGFHKNHGRS